MGGKDSFKDSLYSSYLGSECDEVAALRCAASSWQFI